MGSLGPFEIILIFLVILLIFGAKRIPEIARGLGKGIREFKDATTNIQRDLMVDDQAPRVQPPHGQQAPYTPPQQTSYTPPPQQTPAPPQTPAAPPSESGTPQQTS